MVLCVQGLVPYVGHPVAMHPVYRLIFLSGRRRPVPLWTVETTPYTHWCPQAGRQEPFKTNNLCSKFASQPTPKEAKLKVEIEPAAAAPVAPEKPVPNDESTLAKKWGKTTIGLGYAVVPSILMRSQARLKIGATELAVLVHLIDHWWKPADMPWPSKQLIAERLGVGAKTVQRAMVKLEAAKLIIRKERYQKNGGRTSNEYDLSPLVAMLTEVAEENIKADAEAKKQKWRINHLPKKSKAAKA